MAPREQQKKIKALAGMFATLALMAAGRAHAGVYAPRQGCTITRTEGNDIIFRTPGLDVICGPGVERAWTEKLGRVTRVERFG